MASDSSPPSLSSPSPSPSPAIGDLLRNEEEEQHQQQRQQPSQEEPQQLQQQLQQEKQEEETKEGLYKTKTIQFLGRTTPIILQNENGPCPLLAICNVLLLRNNLNLNPDNSEVSEERLLSLVAERLIDSNSNVHNKDAEYVNNQQQNIADAIDLLPRLATGIDVNIKFRRIDDFEFTRECAIFDLLDIPLYHGWIVDPQDLETSNAIGSKSYNALMGELVALETQNMEVRREDNCGEDSVDFAAATAATLGVPSPCLSKTRSFGDSPPAAVAHRRLRKGDLEEEAELLRALKLSETEPTSVPDSNVATHNGGPVFGYSDETLYFDEDMLADSQDTTPASLQSKNFNQPEDSIPDAQKALINKDNDQQSCLKIDAEEEVPLTCSTAKASEVISHDQQSSKESGEQITCDEELKKSSFQLRAHEKTSSQTQSVERTRPEPTFMDHSIEMLTKAEGAHCVAPNNNLSSSDGKNLMGASQEDKEADNQSTSALTIHEGADKMYGDDMVDVSGSSKLTTASDSSGRLPRDVPDDLSPIIASDEPIYEGEECISSANIVCEDREPVYEGEAILSEKADDSPVDSSKGKASGLTPEQGEMIRNFLKNSASQLTFYGLFRLQDGLKERELCVFFRNNHFSTMFKYEGELYLLATDQGYLNQPDLVWEKLNEVNGDTLFMTGNFKEFKMEVNTNGTWDEHNAMTSTADYLASINSASEGGLDINPDLQLAIALQQQEFEQQSPHSNTQPPAVAGASRLVTGPQGPRSSARPPSSSSSKPEGKKDKSCKLM